MAATENTQPFYNSTIPSDWRVISIKDLTDRKKELFDDGDWIEAEYLTSDGIRLIQTGNIGEGLFIDKEKKKYISEESFIKLKCKELLVGDILICRLAAPAGRACILPNIGEKKMITSVDVSIFRPRMEKADRNYLVAIFSTDNWFNNIRERCGGSTRTRIARGELGKIKIPLPSLPEQKAIANILGFMDEAINKNKELIAQKERRKKWLMQNLLTGKKRLKEFSGEWKDVRFGDVTKNFSRRNKDLVEARIYSVTNSNGFVLQTDHFSREIAGADLTNYKIIKKNEFAYNPARINVGSLAYFEDEIGVISSLYVCFSTTKDILDYYLLQFLQLDHTKYRIENLGEGGVRVYLWYDLIAKIKIKLPSIEEQTAICQVLQAADKEIQLLKEKTDKLKEQKKGMMQQLLTGKKRLKITA